VFTRTLLLCLLAAPVPAAESEIHQLIRQALDRNPEILAAQKRLEAARQRPAQAGSLPDPMLSAGYQSNGGPLPGQGLGTEPTSNIGFSISQQFPAAGKRDLRTRVAIKEASVVEQDYWQVQLQVIAKLKTAWHRLHHAYAQLELLERNRSLLEKILKVSEARYASGKGMQQDIFKAQTQLTLIEAKRTRYEQEKVSLEAEINVLLARPLDAAVPQPPELAPKESTIGLNELYAQAQAHSPVLAREQKSVERDELAVNLARKDGALDYTVSAGYYNMGSMPGMYAAKVDFNLPFFTRARQRAALSEQVNQLSAARRSYQATGNMLLFRIKDDYLMSEASWRLMRIYSTTLIPQAALTFESALPAYENGQADFLTLLNNLLAILDAESNYHEAQMDYHLSLIRLEEATGMQLVDEE